MSYSIKKILILVTLFIAAPLASANHFSPVSSDVVVTVKFDFGNGNSQRNIFSFSNVQFDEFWNDLFSNGSSQIRNKKKARKMLAQIFGIERQRPVSEENNSPITTPVNDETPTIGGGSTVVADVPEPSTLALLVLGVTGLSLSRKLKK